MQLERETEELETIRAARGGLLLPADVVAFARNPETALHAHFEWDDSKAAELARLAQARAVIRLCVTIVSEEVKPTRAYVSLPSDRRAGGGYRSTREVVTDDTRRAEMIRDAMERLQACRRKYADISELAQVWKAVDAAAEQTQGEPVAAAG